MVPERVRAAADPLDALGDATRRSPLCRGSFGEGLVARLEVAGVRFSPAVAKFAGRCSQQRQAPASDGAGRRGKRHKHHQWLDLGEEVFRHMAQEGSGISLPYGDADDQHASVTGRGFEG